MPYLRIGPEGVEGNVNAEEFYASGNPDGVSAPPREARIGGPVRWQRISRTPGWTWFEHRLHPTEVTIPPALRESAERRRLGDWRVPLRVAGRPATVEGFVEYRPLLGQIVPALTGSARPAPGVVAAVLPGPIPGIFLDATAARERVTVLGSAGEPYLRLGPRGAEANLRSPTHHADQRIRGVPPSVDADPRAAPRWKAVGEDARYTWLEPRARYPQEQPPDAVVDGGRREKLVDWTVPLEVGGRRADLRGATSWVPTAEATAERSRGGADDSWGVAGPVVAVLVVLSMLAVGAAVYVGRRRARGAPARPG